MWLLLCCTYSSHRDYSLSYYTLLYIWGRPGLAPTSHLVGREAQLPSRGLHCIIAPLGRLKDSGDHLGMGWLLDSEPKAPAHDINSVMGNLGSLQVVLNLLDRLSNYPLGRLLAKKLSPVQGHLVQLTSLSRSEAGEL